jgi:hypothetical protein
MDKEQEMKTICREAAILALSFHWFHAVPSHLGGVHMVIIGSLTAGSGCTSQREDLKHRLVARPDAATTAHHRAHGACRSSAKGGLGTITT